MDTLICNKCFVPIYRGKQPYNITQCGHISCHGCLQQVEKQCPQCEYVGAVSLPLQEPLMPKVAQFFVPIAETLEMLLKIDIFRSNQMKITMQRFRDIDKKYEMMKTQYWLQRRDMKVLLEKYTNLKVEKEKLDKKLLFSEMHKSTPRSTSSVMKTPADSGIFMLPSSRGYPSESSEFLKSKLTPMRSANPKKQYRTADGFRVPSRPPKSTSSFVTSDTSSNCSFLR